MNKLLILGATAALAMAGAAHATTNVALTSSGASFVGASSAIALATPASALATMQIDPISNPAPAWYYNGDNRYIFGSADPVQSYEIKLGATYTLDAFGASFSAVDRAANLFSVETSLDGMTFTPYALGTLTTTTVDNTTTFALAGASVTANYVEYFFGPASTQYPGNGGSAISTVTASAVPEPVTWAMMIGGFGLIGGMMRRAHRKSEETVAGNPGSFAAA